MATREIKWTDRAKKDLRKTYSFYCHLFEEPKAFEIISELVNKVDILSNEQFSHIGSIDEEFVHLKRLYKKFIVRNIKVTYRLS